MKRNSPIKGLMLYAFHSASGNIALLTVGCLLMGFFISAGLDRIVTAAGNTILYLSFTGLLIMIISSSLLVSASKDTASKWNRFQLAMPVKRTDVIASKYLGHLLMLLIAIVVAGITIGIGIVLHENLRESVIENLHIVISVGIVPSLIACGLFYPAIYTIGENKEEALFIVCLGGSMGIMLFFRWIGNAIGISQNIITILCAAVSVILFVASYVAATKIYAKKDL